MPEADAALCQALATFAGEPAGSLAPAAEALPAAACGERRPDAAGQPLRAAKASSRSFLVVDDSFSTREIQKSMLEELGFRVSLAEDGVDALEQAAAVKFDLVFTDLDMPRMDGFSLVSGLRALEGYRDTPVVIVRSREKEEDKRRGSRAGANAYLVKGDFDRNDLLNTIHKLLC